MLLGLEKPHSLHHVFERRWIGVEEDRLIEFEQRIVSGARRSEALSEDVLAHLRERPRFQAASGVHQAARSDRHHRKTQLFQSDEDTEIVAQQGQHLGNQREVVGRVLHPDQVGRVLAEALDGGGPVATTAGRRPRGVVPASRTSAVRSSTLSVLGSAVVPLTTTPCEPSTTWRSSSRAYAS